MPVIGCRCKVCQSQDWHDKRLRTSAMVECDDIRIVIDAGPDFRQQMLRTGVRHIDAILLTHQHKDHTGGLDDVRAFNFVDYPTIHPIDIYANEATAASVRKDYDYAFVENKYIGAPEMRLHEISAQESFSIKGVKITPIEGKHSDRFTVLGYRIGKFAYLTDFKSSFSETYTIPFDNSLRNISGIIIIDMIDMASREHHHAVLEELNKVFAHDRVKTVVHGFTSLGLVEMTRKRSRPPLKDVYKKEPQRED